MIQRVEAGRELSHGAISELGATLSEQLGRGVTTISMNTSRVVDFDSQALESLLEFDSLAKSRGMAFVLHEPSGLLSIALSITGLDGKLEIRRDAHEQEKEKEKV